VRFRAATNSTAATPASRRQRRRGHAPRDPSDFNFSLANAARRARRTGTPVAEAGARRLLDSAPARTGETVEWEMKLRVATF
ncbi:hypothetical protein Trydic_g10072, partial [Trypoxylus dichotomus]